MQTDVCGVCGYAKPVGGSCLNPSCIHSPRYSPDRKKSSECFAQDTRILTPNSWQRISDLKVGDPVISLDRFDNPTEETIVSTPIKKNGLVYEVLYHEHHRPICVSWCHPFLTESGWKMTWQLRRGDKLHAFDRNSVKQTHLIDQVRRTDRREDLFNLYTTGSHNFVVEGAIVHNFSLLKTFRGWLADARYNLAQTRESPRIICATERRLSISS